MNKKTITFLLSLFLLLAATISASAQPVTLAWDQNPEPEVVGYKIYYRSDSPTLPFNGTILPEGISPIYIDGANNTSLEISIPDDGGVYYFAATAINNNGLESSFSEIIASGWIPYLLAPVEETQVTTAAVFSWKSAPADYDVTFDLYYGTDPEFNLAGTTGPTVSPTDSNKWPSVHQLLLIAIAALFLTGLFKSTSNKRRVWAQVRIAICIGVLTVQFGCGGGGSGEATGSLPTAGSAEAAFTNVVTDIADTQFLVNDLEPGTSYYWKVVAVDNWGNTYESFTKTFTTVN
jgi:fibronectin type 3 domain-containing protein